MEPWRPIRMEQDSHEADTRELPELTDEHRQYLLKLARESVERYVRGEGPVALEYDDEPLKQKCGIFVTLKLHGQLRGCIGNIYSFEPIPETIGDIAVKSASSDPRFPPIKINELPDLEIDISVLGPLNEVKDISEIKIGTHGLVIEERGRRGLLLPQVATEHGFNVEQFLSQTCLKAGLPVDAWKHGARIFKFAAEVF